MALADLIEQLTDATGPDTLLDQSIALVVGFKRTVDKGGNSRKIYWEPPYSGEKSRIPPAFTDSIDVALSLSRIVGSFQRGGVSWNDKGKCTLNDGPVHHAATPALAICIAILSTMDDDAH